jgi:hypothetical protein
VTLQSAIRTLILESLKVLRETELPKKWSYAKYKKLENGTQTVQHSTEPDLRYIYFLHGTTAFVQFENFLNGQSDYQEAIRILSDKNIRLARLEPQNLAMFLVLSHLKHHPSLKINSRLTMEIARNFEDCIKNQRAGVRLFCPVQGIKSSIRNLNLGNGINLKKFTKNQMLRLVQPKSIDDPYIIPVWEHAVEINATHSFGDKPKGWADRGEQIRRLAQTFRILKSDKVAIPRSISMELKPGYINLMSGNSDSHFKTPIFSENYRLFPSEQENLKNTFDALGSSMAKRVKIAADRIGMSTQRQSDEDEFIDYIVALEAMFGDRDIASGSFTYKVALRATMFMNDKKEMRAKEFKLLKKALNLRGKVVHGAAQLKELKADEKEAVDWLSAFSRSVLVKILHEHPNFTEDTPDNYIFSLLLPN